MVESILIRIVAIIALIGAASYVGAEVRDTFNEVRASFSIAHSDCGFADTVTC